MNDAPLPMQKPLIPKGEPNAKDDHTQVFPTVQKRLEPSGVSVPMFEEGTVYHVVGCRLVNTM